MPSLHHVALAVALAACSSAPALPLPSPDAPAATPDGAPVPPPPPLPGPSHAYVANFLGGILIYDVDADGGLAPVGDPVEPHTSFYGIALAPSAPFAYALDSTGEVVVYAVDAHGGLGRIGTTDLGATAQSLAIDAQGRFLYTTAGDAIAVFALDPIDGSLAKIEGSPFATDGTPLYVATDRAGRYLYASRTFDAGILAFALDPTSGAPSKLDGSPFGVAAGRGGALSVSPDGRSLYSGGGDISGYTIAPDGSPTRMAGSPLAVGAGSDPYATDLAIDPAAPFLMTVTTAANHLNVFRVDAAGVPHPIDGSPFDGGESPYAVAIDANGRFAFVGNDDAALLSVFAIDPTSGTPTPVTGSPFPMRGLQPEITTR